MPTYSQLDLLKIFQLVVDESTGRLKVGIDATVAGGQEILITAVHDSIQAYLLDATGSAFSASNPLPVTSISSGLPAGAATAARQDTGNSSLASIDTKTPTVGQKAMSASSPVVIASDQSALPVTGTFFQGTQPVSAAALPLPSGASTSALQTTGNTSLSSIDTKLVITANGVKTDGSAITQPVSASSLPLPTGASTSALQTAGNTSLSSIDGKMASLGQKAMASSMPMVVASDQSAIPVSAASLPLPSGAATSSLQTTGNTSLASILGQLDNKTSTLATAAGQTTIIANQTNGTQKTQSVDGSGTVQGPLQTISGTNYAPVVLASSATPGAAIVSRSIQVAGSDGTNARTIATDTTGKPNINNISGTVSLPTGAATSSNQTTIISNLQAINSLTPSTYDYISLSYTGTDLTGVVFKTGGSGGSTISTLTLAYSLSILQSVTRT